MRSLMFVPAHKQKLLDSSARRDADVLLLDIEDSVPVFEKQNARNNIKNFVLRDDINGKLIFPRVNDRESGELLKDLYQLTTDGITGFMYPKATKGEDIYFVGKLLETTEYEKKVALETKKPKSWCKTISAFANGKGGKLIFGVDDNDNIVGLTNMKKDSEDISEIIKNHLNPMPKFDMSFKSIDGKDIIVVEVFAGEQTPYYYDGDGQLIAFLRVGNESVPASPIELRELILTSYDSLKAHFDFSDMSFSKLKSVYKQNTGNSFEDTDYESFGIVNSKGELTNAGVLIADECPLRHSRVFCTRWNGLTKASGVVDAIDDNEYSGSLIILLQEAYNFVLRNSKKAWMKENDKRVELPDYPERAVMEGIVNALIHRSYTELGSEVHIDMFDDRRI